jgi:hypothetical protein
MVSSASFPPAVGPVTYGIAGGQPRYEHVGDGGLFDNLGTESLATFFLKKIPRGSSKRGLIIVIDAAFPFDANQAFLDGNQRGFEVFKNDPSRIVGIMEERANAYQLMLWDALRTQGILLPDFANLRVEVLRHTEPDWGVFKDLPEACRGHFSEDVTTKAIKEAVSQIPTRFQDCGMTRPRALAVLTLITSSTLVGSSTGRSAGFAPLKILWAKLAAWRYISG